jgi:hypothetical protein
MLPDSNARCAAQGTGEEGINREGSLEGGGEDKNGVRQALINDYLIN